MFPIVTAETARRIDMSKIVGMCVGVNFLIVEYRAVIDRLDLFHSRLDDPCILTVKISRVGLVIFFNRRNGFDGFVAGFVFDTQHFDRLGADGENGRVDQFSSHGLVHRFSRDLKVVRHTVMTSGAVDILELAFIHACRVKTGFYISVFGECAVIVGDAHVWNFLIQRIRGIVLDLVRDMPVNTFAKAFTLVSAASLQDQVGG